MFTYWEEIKVLNSCLKWARVELAKNSFMEACKFWVRTLLGLFLRMFSIVEKSAVKIILGCFNSKEF